MKKKKEGKYMKTYKHNNNELITEECLAILHKNAKNIRIRKAEERRRAKRLGFFWTVKETVSAEPSPFPTRSLVTVIQSAVLSTSHGWLAFIVAV